MELPYFNTGIAILCRNRCAIAQFTAKQLSHFVTTDFDKLPKEGGKQVIWNS